MKKELSFKELQEAAVALNKSGLISESIKPVGVSKEKLMKEFLSALEELPDDVKLPKIVKDVHNKIAESELIDIPEGECSGLPGDPDPEDDPPTEKKKAAPKKEAAKKAPVKKEKPPKEEKAPGVIATILNIIKTKGPISKENIKKALSKAFPDRDASKMSNTINVQIGGKSPCRMEKERKVEFIIDKDGNYSVR